MEEGLPEMIDVKHLSKSYGMVQAVKDVSFHVDAGEVIGLLGPNGAGKTTLMKILTGYLQPDEGEVWVDGIDVVADPLAVQSRIGYLPENAPLYPELTVQAYLRLMADLRQIPAEQQPALLTEAILAAGLQDYLTRPIGELSKGYRQRVGIAQAILHKPKLLILDEPTVGLDPTQVLEVRRLIRRLAKTSTILLSTHILSEVEATCQRVIILMNGEVKADARLQELEATSEAVLVLGEAVPGALTALKGLPGVRSVERFDTPHGVEYHIRGENGVDVRPAVFRLAREQDWPVYELRRHVRTLEAVFNELATSAGSIPAKAKEVRAA